MKLIVGIGNPGKKYSSTRHNVGFMTLDNFAKQNNFIISSKKFNGLIGKININGVDAIFLKPNTFVNLSGRSVSEVVNFYKIKLEDILVIQDDLDMDFGKTKIKTNSSSGGHNGIKSISENLKSNSYIRLKIGINNEYKKDVRDFVLSKFSKFELASIELIFDKTERIIKDFLNEDCDYLANKYN